MDFQFFKNISNIWVANIRNSFCLVMFFLICGLNVLASENQIADSQSEIPIHWKTGRIRVALSESLRIQTATGRINQEFIAAIKRSLRNWESAGDIEFVENWTSENSASRNGKPGDGINLITIAPTAENLSLFEESPFEIASRTKVYFNSKGIISEADIVLNPLVQFSTDGSYGTVDLESTVTHELGHLLGLDHSFVIGSVMYSHQSKNTSTLPLKFFVKGLSSDDVFGIRSLYGVKSEDDSCCGILNGKISAKGSNRQLKVWLEDAVTGNVSAGFTIRSDSPFRLTGLSPGEYRVFAVDNDQTSTVQSMGMISVKRGISSSLIRNLKIFHTKLSVSYLGQSDLKSELSAIFIPDSTGTVTLVGSNLTSETNIVFDSPFLSVVKGSVVYNRQDSNHNTITFDVKIAESATSGNYSINVVNNIGQRVSLIGVITIVQK